jgi:nitrate reductase delta subunit
MKTFKILSALLSYPSDDLIAAASSFGVFLEAEAIVPPAHRRALADLIADIAGGDVYDLQERYGLLFDRSKTLSLHLFEHVHGESRDRGQAMVDLKATYEAAGLEIAANELPDFVPLFLEFLSIQPLEAARELLGQPSHILAALGERLGQRRSRYRAVFDALVAIAAEAPSRAAVEALLDLPDVDPMDLRALDAAWEEEEVRFGPGTQGQGACGQETLIARLRAARRKVEAAPVHQNQGAPRHANS